MSAKDLFHNAVKQALILDGWTITNDPLIVRYYQTSPPTLLHSVSANARRRYGNVMRSHVRSVSSDSDRMGCSTTQDLHNPAPIVEKWENLYS